MANLLSLPFTFVIVSYVFIPVFMQTRVTSAYELLEARLGLGIRLLGAVMFLVLQLLFMSMLLYLAAKALSIMLGLDESSIPWVAFVMGLVAATYTSMGGCHHRRSSGTSHAGRLLDSHHGRDLSDGWGGVASHLLAAPVG